MIASIGAAGLYLTRLPCSIWIAIIWTLWILVNYLFLIRIKVCRYCCYYGQNCPMGWGTLVPFFISQGEIKRFSKQKWPIIYFCSFAAFPSLLMIISLIFDWNLRLAFIFFAFSFLGLSLYVAARTKCCNKCDMEPSCLLTKLNPCRKSVEFT